MTLPLHIHITAHVLQTIFMVGVAGCLISIPIIAIKFASVLFERDRPEGGESQEVKEDEQSR
jgi:hypothetical protein